MFNVFISQLLYRSDYFHDPLNLLTISYLITGLLLNCEPNEKGTNYAAENYRCLQIWSELLIFTKQNSQRFNDIT